LPFNIIPIFIYVYANANLVVKTLPMPRKTIATAPLCMAWVKTLSQGLPPFLFGNQQSVLTFYSFKKKP
jgi:hypothetical protein